MEPVLIDEWQIVLKVLGAIRRAVDLEPRPGRHLVRGEFDSSTWPGTGRLLGVPMYGLTLAEFRRRTAGISAVSDHRRGAWGLR